MPEELISKITKKERVFFSLSLRDKLYLWCIWIVMYGVDYNDETNKEGGMMKLFDQITDLNETYAIPSVLCVCAGPGKIPHIIINNRHASAVISLYGAQILDYRPVHQKPVLWITDMAGFTPGKAIRGGIPQCWPWFGKHPDDTTKPAHGFARISYWQLSKTAVMGNGSTLVELVLKDSEETLKLWSHHFTLTMTAVIGSELCITLKTTNPDLQSFQFTGALHTYFNVSDTESIEISGLDGISYIDTTKPELPTRVQEGPIRLTEYHNRIYRIPNAAMKIIDTGYRRSIAVESKNSGDIVTWNPHIEGSVSLSDLAPLDFRRFFCLETANVSIPITLFPGESHSLTQTIRFKKYSSKE